MKKFFYSHPDSIIAALALIFLGLLLAFYSWASDDIYTEVYRALTFSPSQSAESFNLAGAEKLDLRGLVNGSSSTAAPSAFAPRTATSTSATSTP